MVQSAPPLFQELLHRSLGADRLDQFDSNRGFQDYCGFKSRFIVCKYVTRFKSKQPGKHLYGFFRIWDYHGYMVELFNHLPTSLNPVSNKKT